MKFEEILPALREGEKIRRRGWTKSAYILIGKDDLVCDQNDEVFLFVLGDFEDEYWEIVRESKKVKLRDLTEEQYKKWIKNNCSKYDTDCHGCPFQKVKCDNSNRINDVWYLNKDLYSDNFLNQEIEIEEE